MYPPLTSPTSPHDVPMTDLNILNTKTVLPQKLISTTSPTSSLSSSSASSSPIPPPTSINDQYHNQQLKKSTDTLRNNIDFKNESYKKRTSLKIEDDSNSTNNNNNGNSTEEITRTLLNDNCIDNARHSMILSKSQRNSRNFDNHNGNDSTTSNSDAEDALKNGNGTELDNRKFRRVRRRNNRSNSNIDTNGDEDEADYNDMKNGSASDSTHKRDSVTSKGSSDDYFLCEKFKNSLNAKLNGESEVDGTVNGAEQAEIPMDLLSPHEGPMGRRYAEITPAKHNKW